jgi:uncharacterized membrane protein (DUF485 family)
MVTESPTRSVPPEGRSVAVQQSADFVALRRAFRRFVFPVTVAFLVWYGLYVLLSAYARCFMSHKLFGNINVALVFGLLQFLSTFLIAWAYTWYADRHLDSQADQVRRDMEAGA